MHFVIERIRSSQRVVRRQQICPEQQTTNRPQRPSIADAPSTGFVRCPPKIRRINVRCSLRNKLFVSLVRATCHYHRALVAKRRPLHSCKPLSSLLKKFIKVPLSIKISYEHKSRGANRSMSAGLPGFFSVTIVSATYVYRTRPVLANYLQLIGVL